MVCKQCATETKVFDSKVAIHFPGLAGLNKPIVWVFPKLRVCLHCGSTEFNVPRHELDVLEENVSVAA